MINHNYNDKKTWQLFAEGKTKGVFQLESNLGKSWSKKLQPNNIEELCALVSVIRPGCISGDTFITISKYLHADKKHRFIRKKIKDIYNLQNKPAKIFSLNTDNYSIIQNDMVDIFYSGQKECFKVKIRKYSMSGQKKDKHPKWYDLECTADHKLLTNNGWVALENIKEGDRIACYKKQNNRNIRNQTICNRHTKNGPRMTNVDGTKYFSEICYKHYEEKCVICDWDKTTLDVHHVEGNRHTNNNFKNLVYLCPNCHRLHNNNKVSTNEILSNRDKHSLPLSKDIEWVTYIGKESVGIKDTYDISMASPCNNFIAGNFIVHNCLKAYADGKSMTQHYVDRKHGREEVTYFHPALEDILKPTYGVLIYQEQSMRIAQKIAGFNLQEADTLRKAIGKKKADLMNEVKKAFIEGSARVGIVKKEEAEQIFEWIEKSSRYSFNKSHGVSYAVCSYWSAYQKAHNTKQFFLSYLYHANEKQDPHREIYELVSEAKLFDIQVKTPNLSNYENKFNIKNNTIYFGIKDIKSLTGNTGDKLIQSIAESEKEAGKKIKEFSWLEILLFLSPKINSASFKALASIGFFKGFSEIISRNKALYDYDIFKNLTASEKKWLTTHYAEHNWNNLIEALTSLSPTKKEGGGTSKAERKQIIENEIQLLVDPPYDLEDDPSWIIDQETKFLGCPISLSRIEASDTSAANTTCKEIINGKRGKDLCIVANIQRLSEYKTTKGETKGQLMAFLTIEDETCILDSVIVFPAVKDKYKYVLYEGNNLIFCGSVTGKDNAFIIDAIHEIV